MPYKTLLVHLGVGQQNSEVLKVASEISTSLATRLVGIAVCQPMVMAYADGYVGTVALADCQEELLSELATAEAEFRGHFAGSTRHLEWRSDYTADGLAHFLTCEARSADLIITSATNTDLFDSSRHISIGELVMSAGRPLLFVPKAGTTLPFDNIVIAWKDSREARRAAADALPILTLAKQITVVEVAAEADVPAARRRTDDVVNWLGTHGIAAASMAITAYGDEAEQFEALLTEMDCDLVVAGAYGHNRVREWVFGGFTRTLLKAERCVLLSH